jgi:hypothetical protein
MILTYNDSPRRFLSRVDSGRRTGLVASAVLFESGKANSPEVALASVQAVRPGVELKAIQKQALLSLKVPTLSN